MAVEADDSVAPWHGTVLILAIVAAASLHGLSSVLPIEPPFLRAAIVAAVIVTLSLATSVLARRRAGRVREGPS